MFINLQPTIQDELVQIRPLLTGDFKDLYTVASDPLLWEQHQNKDRYKLENFKEFFNEGIASKAALGIIDLKSQTLIGSSRFKIIDEGNKVIEIGWSFLSRTYWGGEYNRRFKKLMVNHALEHFKYVIFYVNPKNYRSQRAMEKLGASKMVHGAASWVLKEEVGMTYCISSKLKD